MTGVTLMDEVENNLLTGRCVVKMVNERNSYKGPYVRKIDEIYL